jgi:cytidylate kinase
MLLIFAGLPGTGKSTLARALAPRLNATILDKDLVREAMFGPDRITFTTEQDDVVIDTMLRSAADIIRENPSASPIPSRRAGWLSNAPARKLPPNAVSPPTSASTLPPTERPNSTIV